MDIEGEEERVFIDSGAPFSIYNPPSKDPQKDKIAGLMKPSSSRVNCKFRGVGGGRIEAAGNGYLRIRVSNHIVDSRFVALKKHEPTLPRFLLGMDIITGELEGIRIKRDTVRFEIDPTVVFKSALQIEAEDAEQEEIISLVEGGEERRQGWTKHFQTIAEHEEFKWTTPNPDQDREGMEQSIFKVQEETRNEAFEDAPLPMVATTIRVDGEPQTAQKVQLIIDSGSNFNLISQALALQLREKQLDRREKQGPQRTMPQCRTANGEMMTASQCLWLQLEYQSKLTTEAVPFYVFDQLPVAAILGHDTCEEWKAELAWGDKTFKFTPRSGVQVSLPWASREGKYWRGAVNLLAKRDYMIPGGSQQKIMLSLEEGALSNQGIRGNAGLITKQNQPRKYDVPLAVEDKRPTWMQVRNLARESVHIKKGEVVALFHPRQGYSIEAAPGLDPTREDIAREKLVASENKKQQQIKEKEMAIIWKQEMQQGYVRLIQPQQDQPKPIEKEKEGKMCGCCKQEKCPEYVGEEKARKEQDEKLVEELGVDLSIPRRWRTECEVGKLVQWALRWTSASINMDCYRRRE